MFHPCFIVFQPNKSVLISRHMPWIPMASLRMPIKNVSGPAKIGNLGGGFKDFFFSPLLGEMIHDDPV